MRFIKLLFLSFLLILLVGCTFNKKEGQKHEDYIKQIINLNEKVKELTEERNEMLDKLKEYESEIFEEGECVFTKTYEVISLMETNEVADEELSLYVMLDQYNINEPFVVKLTKDQVSILGEGQNYEFTFSGARKYKIKEKDDIFKYYTIDGIKETKKVGLDQKQEMCT